MCFHFERKETIHDAILNAKPYADTLQLLFRHLHVRGDLPDLYPDVEHWLELRMFFATSVSLEILRDYRRQDEELTCTDCL